MTRLNHPRTLLVVLILPLLVVGLGMWALSGRVDRLDAVPAAVVNLDEGAEIEDADGEVQDVPFGRMLAGALTQPGTVEEVDAPDTTGFDWQLTEQSDARDGLADGTYAAVVVIPEDFSADLSTIGTPEAAPAILEVTTNDAGGQINALVATAVAEASASTMGGQMAQQYLDGLYLGFNDMKSSFSEAADGAEELADGTEELDDGVQELDGGVQELDEGAQQSAEGTREFSGGVWSLADGAGQTADGTRQLADGLDELAVGTGGAASGSDDLATGLDELATGNEDLAEGVAALQTGMNGTETEPGLLDGAQQLAAGVEGDGTAENPGLEAGADQLATGLEQFAGGVDEAGTVVSGDGTAANPGLVPTAQEVADGTAELGEGAQQLADGVSGSEQEPGLPEGAQDVADGAAELAAGIEGDGTEQDPGMVGLAEQMVADATAERDAAQETAEEDPERLVRAETALAQAQGMLEYANAVDTGLGGDGSAENPGLVGGTQGLADGASELLPLGPQLQQLADGINGTEEEPGLVQGTEGVVTYAQGVQTAFDGDGTAENPGLVASSEQLADGARDSADGTAELVGGVTGLRDGLQEYASGVDELAGGATQLAEGARSSADGAGDLATGLDELAGGTRSSADGAGELAGGTEELADGTRELAGGSDALAEGSAQLADGTGELADATGELTDGTGELAEGTEDLAGGLREGADEVPSYTEDERSRMSEMAASPVDTSLERENQASGATTATFPFVAALALWLGAFGSFLLLPALSRRLLDGAVPMWQVVLRSLVPPVLIAVVQTVAVLAVITAIGISPVSPLAVGAVAFAGAVMFAALHQALMALLGDRIGRIASIVVMTLQVVTLVGIVPLETAPELLQSVSGLMPLSIVTQGLVHASLGGTLVTTASTLLAILAWGVISVLATMFGSRTARRADRSERAVAKALPAAV